MRLPRPLRRAGRPYRDRRRWRRRDLPVALVVLVLLAPAVYSYTTTMLQPSSLPLWPRSVEWLRAHHGNWLVDEVEHYYYSWKTPAKGGPQLTSLPTVGVADAAPLTSASPPPRLAQPPPITPVFAHPLPGEGVWRGTGPTVVRGARRCSSRRSGPRSTIPRIVAYVAWFDHTRTSAAWYPGRYEPPNAPDPRARCRCPTASAGACSPRSTAASSTATATTDRRSTGGCTSR